MDNIADAEALELLEAKVRKLELQVYGENYYPSENFNPVIDSLLQANTVMTTAVSGMEKFTLLYKRLKELNNYLEMNPVSDDPTQLSTKLNIILTMGNEYKSNVELLEKITELKEVLDDDRLTSAETLKDDLNDVIASHMSKRERLDEINNEVGEILTNFNEVCLEISKSFFLLNEAITKLENTGRARMNFFEKQYKQMNPLEDAQRLLTILVKAQVEETNPSIPSKELATETEIDPKTRLRRVGRKGQTGRRGGKFEKCLMRFYLF